MDKHLILSVALNELNHISNGNKYYLAIEKQYEKRRFSMNYDDLPEIISITQAAKLVKIGRATFTRWIHTGHTPMGDIRDEYHYYREGVPYKIIKSRLCELFGITENRKERQNELRAKHQA